MEADLDVALELADPRLGRVALGRREERALRDAPELRLDLGGAVGGTRGDRSRRRRRNEGRSIATLRRRALSFRGTRRHNITRRPRRDATSRDDASCKARRRRTSCDASTQAKERGGGGERCDLGSRSVPPRNSDPAPRRSAGGLDSTGVGWGSGLAVCCKGVGQSRAAERKLKARAPTPCRK